MPHDAKPLRLVPVRVWDPAVRIFHWAIVILVGFCWWTAETGRMEWHTKAGQCALALVVFRILWGFFGRGTARFSSFVRGPEAVLEYAARFGKRVASHSVGHNPMGALSVLALLAVLALQTWSGMFAIDTDQEYSGPLSNLLSYDGARAAAELHEWSFSLIQILVVLHVAVVLFYLVWKRENLVAAMVSGNALLPSGTSAPALGGMGRAVALALLSAVLVWLIANYGVRAVLAVT